ncbi:unnamed protein product, partial [Nesidiocoris tenuis]
FTDVERFQSATTDNARRVHFRIRKGQAVRDRLHVCRTALPGRRNRFTFKTSPARCNSRRDTQLSQRLVLTAILDHVGGIGRRGNQLSTMSAVGRFYAQLRASSAATNRTTHDGTFLGQSGRDRDRRIKRSTSIRSARRMKPKIRVLVLQKYIFV